MLKIKQNHNSYKIGVNEIDGLHDAMHAAMVPVVTELQDRAYWISELSTDPVEYKSRDGFFAHSHNLGGAEIQLIIPQCESSSFDFLQFGECDYYDDPECASSCGPDGDGCTCDDEGGLSASLRIWLKLESFDETTGECEFYLYAGGGNGDAPYFRTYAEKTIFEHSFKAKSLTEFKRKASFAVNKLLGKMS